MNSGLSPGDPTLSAAFLNALLHQGEIALAIVVFLLLLWATARTLHASAATAGASAAGAADTADEVAGGKDRDESEQAAAGPGGFQRLSGFRDWGRLLRSGQEAPARKVLRIGFGLLWVLDGFLQAQPKMAAGLPSQVIAPAATVSPLWVQHLDNWGATIWSYHPIQAAAASVWIQLGLGAWMLVSVRGPWSRLAGLAGVGWGLIVWIWGEAFGGIFAPGLTFLFGAPGSVLLYVVAGALIALPDRAWHGPRMGRLLASGIGLFFIGMAVLQAWPGRGFWQGGKNGTLPGMISSMASTPQPHFLTALVNAAATFTSAHGWGVNLSAVSCLAVMGVLFLTSRPQLVRYAMWFGIVFCLVAWVFIQDLGFLGGLGTDPNTMIPMIVLLIAGYVALQPVVEADAAVQEDAVSERAGSAAGWRLRPEALSLKALRLSKLREGLAAASPPTLAAICSVAVILIGVAPMAVAATNPNADPIIAQAVDGTSATLDLDAPSFHLTDQNGHPVSLASLRGKVVLMTFLDPVCTTDCPIIGSEFKEAGVLLGADDKDVELIAVIANPTYYSTAVMKAYDAEAGLTNVPNWHYLTGPLSQLKQMWDQYGVTVENLPAGSMTAHNDIAIVINPESQILQELNADPGPATTTTQSSFSVLLANYARQAMASS
jgi:cytochrome oxidase Cu insertion factor (SCO1/SenC/PrrC family)